MCGWDVLWGTLAWSLRLLSKAGIKCDKVVMVVQFPSKVH